jgi:cbb3-type cytochrome oxidase subunit 3
VTFPEVFIFMGISIFFNIIIYYIYLKFTEKKDRQAIAKKLKEKDNNSLKKEGD